ncbi:MAG: glutamine amidotransferase [Kutzneria sp.]|nr:glutamine amidotransferase [Kutzneria sp.]
MTKYVHLYVLDGLSDWEPGYILAELNSGRYFAEPGASLPVRTVGATMAPIRTLGGIGITPELTVAELAPDDSSLLVLPGADTWLTPEHCLVLDKAREFLAAGVPVAAICGATIALAEAGILDERPHTSNDPQALSALAPSYRGGEHYVGEPAVTDGDLITASGTAPVEFAREVFRRLGVFSPATVNAWYGLHTERTAEQFAALMHSLPVRS